MKFGGTSVGTLDALGNVREIVESQDDRVVVVVSALGGLTDSLIAGAHAASRGDIAYGRAVEEVTRRHNDILNAMVDSEEVDTALNGVRGLLAELNNAYADIARNEELTEADLEEVVSYGERLSSLVVSYILPGARHFNALDMVRSRDHECDVEATNVLVQKHLGEKFRGRVAVIGGFISRDSNTRRISNLGRGGSDYTAALLAAALDADCLEIWTDVDGFMTDDPKANPEATVIPKMTYDEAQQRCNNGAKVIYAPSIQPVAQKNIPIIVKNTFNPSAPGTVISLS